MLCHDIIFFVGVAYIFQRPSAVGTWSEAQIIMAADFAAGAFFGVSVALYDNLIVVGAYLDDNTQGKSSGMMQESA